MNQDLVKNDVSELIRPKEEDDLSETEELQSKNSWTWSEKSPDAILADDFNELWEELAEIPLDESCDFPPIAPAGEVHEDDTLVTDTFQDSPPHPQEDLPTTSSNNPQQPVHTKRHPRLSRRRKVNMASDHKTVSACFDMAYEAVLLENLRAARRVLLDDVSKADKYIVALAMSLKSAVRAWRLKANVNYLRESIKSVLLTVKSPGFNPDTKTLLSGYLRASLKMLE